MLLLAAARRISVAVTRLGLRTTDSEHYADNHHVERDSESVQRVRHDEFYTGRGLLVHARLVTMG
jgi:predicted transposase YdaD